MNYFDIKIKTASINDIIEHLTLCSQNFNPPLDSYVDINEYSKKIFKNALTFEYWDKNKLIGLVAVYYNDQTGKTGFITNVSVIKTHHKMGIGKALLNSAIEYGEKNNFIELKLEVYPNNASAINLYKKLGFKIIEQNKKLTMLKLFK